MAQPPTYRTIAERASSQAGCVSRAELLGAGFSAGQLRTLLRRGALLPIVPGVYAFGMVELGAPALWWAGLLVGGQGARVAGRSALEAHGVLPASLRQVTISQPRRGNGGQRRQTTGLATAWGRTAEIIVSPTARLEAAVRPNGLWTDPVARALADLAAGGVTPELRRAWREADYLGLLHHGDVRAQLRAGRPGAPGLRQLLQEIPIVGSGATLLSRAERRLLEAWIAAGHARPAVNERVDFGGRVYRPDFYFVLAGLIVEVDGPAHRLPARQAEDAARDEYLASVGIDVLRFTDDDVSRDTNACVELTAERLLARLVLRRAERRTDECSRATVG